MWGHCIYACDASATYRDPIYNKMKMKTTMKATTKMKRKDMNAVMIGITTRSVVYTTALIELIHLCKSVSSTVPWGSNIYLPTLSGFTTVSL